MKKLLVLSFFKSTESDSYEMFVFDDLSMAIYYFTKAISLNFNKVSLMENEFMTKAHPFKYVHDSFVVFETIYSEC